MTRLLESALASGEVQVRELPLGKVLPICGELCRKRSACAAGLGNAIDVTATITIPFETAVDTLEWPAARTLVNAFPTVVSDTAQTVNCFVGACGDAW